MARDLCASWLLWTNGFSFSHCSLPFTQQPHIVCYYVTVLHLQSTHQELSISPWACKQRSPTETWEEEEGRRVVHTLFPHPLFNRNSKSKSALFTFQLHYLKSSNLSCSMNLKLNYEFPHWHLRELCPLFHTVGGGRLQNHAIEPITGNSQRQESLNEHLFPIHSQCEKLEWYKIE